MSWKETDPIALWKTSSVIPSASEVNVFDKSTPPLSPQTTTLWKGLQKMTPGDQKAYLRKLCRVWPYRWERYAMEYAQHPIILLSGASAFYIGNRISASVFLNRPRAGIIETLRTAPKLPSVLLSYACSIMAFGFWEVLVRTRFIETDKPCTSCLLSNGVLVAVGCGTVLPLVSTPFLCQSILLNTLNNEEKYIVKNMFEAFAMMNQYTTHVKTRVPALIVLQTLLASATVYAHNWANEKIFNTFDADPELIKATVMQDEKEGKANEYLSNLLGHQRVKN